MARVKRLRTVATDGANPGDVLLGFEKWTQGIELEALETIPPKGGRIASSVRLLSPGSIRYSERLAELVGGDFSGKTLHDLVAVPLGKQGLRFLSASGYRVKGTDTSATSVPAEGDIDASPPGRVKTTTDRVLRDTPLAQRVKELHKHRCQICGLVIESPDGWRYSEAHHIQPLGSPHDGPDVAGNIIVLCPNHHVMCDYGLVRIDLERVHSHPEHIVGTEFVRYHNTEIAVTPRGA